MSNPFTRIVLVPPTTPEPDLCKCSECGNTFKISECATDYDHHDGWEMPAYTAIYCSICFDGVGCIDDFFYSDDAIDKLAH